MATNRQTVDFILKKLGSAGRFSARAMFGEYALYSASKVVALLCDDRLYVKIMAASSALESHCEKGHPYPGAKLHYIVDEGQLSTISNLPSILIEISESMPEKKLKRKT